jgi:hypothetical protein
VPSERENRSPTAIGFAGLSAQVSEVDDVIASATKRAAAARRRAAVTATASPGSRSQSSDGRSQQPFASSQRTGSAGRWIWGAGAVLFVLWLIGVASNRSGSSTVAPESSIEQRQPQDASGIATPAGQQPYTPSPAPSSPVEQLPPIGPDRVLDAAQIRYCLSEDIRLEAARNIANVDADVERFNSMINDYNARCANYRYRRQVFESVQREVQANRASLHAEGVARFRR